MDVKSEKVSKSRKKESNAAEKSYFTKTLESKRSVNGDILQKSKAQKASVVLHFHSILHAQKHTRTLTYR